MPRTRFLAGAVVEHPCGDLRVTPGVRHVIEQASQVGRVGVDEAGHEVMPTTAGLAQGPPLRKEQLQAHMNNGADAAARGHGISDQSPCTVIHGPRWSFSAGFNSRALLK